MKSPLSGTDIIRLLVLMLPLGCLFREPAGAQTFTTLHTFTATSANASGVYTNSEGTGPFAGLILSGNTLYGSAPYGGSSAHGTLFKVNTDGTGFAVLHTFTTVHTPDPLTNSDGGWPGALALSGSTLYGTTQVGGNSGNGTVFAINTDGSDFTNLHQFTATDGNSGTNSDGANPLGGLILSGNTLYGTAVLGGPSGYGTMFAVKTDGTGFTNLYDFTGGTGRYGPAVATILSDNTLYGKASDGGVFAVKTDGTGFTNLFDMDGVPLILSGSTLYGVASGSYNFNVDATVFRINTDGTGFTNLCYLGPGNMGGLILAGNTLFGIAQDIVPHEGYVGGVFSVNTDGTGFTTLHKSFFGPEAGLFPGFPGLILSGRMLYGTTYNNNGGSPIATVFSLSFRPQLTITPSGPNIILSWPTNYDGFDYTGFTLESTTNLASPIWTTNLSAPVVVNGQNTFTTPISGTQQYFRLSQ